MLNIILNWIYEVINMEKYYKMIGIVYEKYEEGLITERAKNSLIKEIRNKIDVLKANKKAKDIDDRTEEMNDLFAAYKPQKKILKDKTNDTEVDVKNKLKLKSKFA
jgi:hypothetical protein